jgi:serine/threonine-protein kinase
MRSRATSPPDVGKPRSIGRYLLHREIASGGMATVHLGRLMGPVGFSRTVAIKRLHPHFERDPEFVAMFLDEARIAARIRHPNVVQTLDVVAEDGELFLVMDYVEWESFAKLLRALARTGEPIAPQSVVLAVVCGALHGLHAAHEANGESGERLCVVHRDVSPQNILVGLDGTPRVLDFGIAKALGRAQVTRSGMLKGKLAYMAPEQIRNADLGPRTDIYAASVVLWEALTGARLFKGDEGAVMGQIAAGKIVAPVP